MRQTDQQHFCRRHGLRRGGDLGMSFQQHLPGATKAGNAHIRQCSDGCALSLQKAVSTAASRNQAGPVDEVHQIGDGHFGFSPVGVGAGKRIQCASCITGHGGIKHGNRISPARPAQHSGNIVGADLVGSHGGCLIKQGQRVTHRSFGCAGNHVQCLRVCINGLMRADAGQMGGQNIAVHTPQIKPLAARQDGDGHLANLGRGEDELYIVRRFFQRFQQRVEGTLRHHVNFVDDINLVARRHWPIADTFNDVAGIIHTGMAGSIDFQNIDMPRGGNCHTWLARAAWLQRCITGSIGTDTVQAAGQQARCRGFADTADAGQNKGMRKPAK